ncbi:MAG: FadR/GntR family transcriptional regulator [Arthrobacter sp.]|uniref:FadR/GntR family transcriptional regulator n=1 Tax=Arthrobacter sp. 179 TaxID=3457734 RepID=UPI00264C26F5|nr:FadR family transcriptional regulator [Micrococcaceae bacterium]MDN5824505.1 FadR family transcriptional regulator [Micrococcaceae bacterium]MDN5906195.1 FadR family transcriptional regulator [Micrococcaceae bacterium]MDN6169750.1 FadR family transcriptional regulator [Micrococcaceae bacterium]MDN6332804.1 FadR family transcriptional regulator [Micrococcaceae bacterium]
MAVTDEAIDKIKGMLLREELKAGDRLPPEKELAERLGLSRNSLREAVKALELIRVLDVRRGDGTYVTSLDANLLNGAVAFIVELHQDRSVLELFEVRRILEPASGFMAASRMSAEDLKALRATMEGIDETTGIEELVAHDLDFHRIIGQAAGNEYLGSLVEALSGSTVRARIWRGLTQDHAVARTLAEHQAIADALERGDAELTRALLTVHVSGVEAWLREAM